MFRLFSFEGTLTRDHAPRLLISLPYGAPFLKSSTFTLFQFNEGRLAAVCSWDHLCTLSQRIGDLQHRLCGTVDRRFATALVH